MFEQYTSLLIHFIMILSFFSTLVHTTYTHSSSSFWTRLFPSTVRDSMKPYVMGIGTILFVIQIRQNPNLDLFSTKIFCLANYTYFSFVEPYLTCF